MVTMVIGISQFGLYIADKVHRHMDAQMERILMSPIFNIVKEWGTKTILFTIQGECEPCLTPFSMS